MASVPDTSTFTLQNVVDVVNPTTDDLADCLSDAITAYYDPDYNNDTYAPANSLLRFRNYGDSQGGYGYLYNWYAASHSSFAPDGWHVPTESDIDALITELGGYTIAGGKLKQVGLTHWESPNTDATDTYGFSALGGGYRYPSGTFTNLHELFYIWLDESTGNTTTGIWHDSATLYYGGEDYRMGLTLRLIKDDSTDPGYLEDYEGNVYTTVKIGSQVWTKQNWRSAYLNKTGIYKGTPLTKVTSSSTWAAATTGNNYYCSYDNNDAYSTILVPNFVGPNATYSVSKSGGSTNHSFGFTNGGTVSITQYSSWLSGSNLTADTNSGVLTLVYTANDAAARTGTVTVTNSTTGAQMVVTVSQAKGYVLTLSVSNLSFSQAGSETKTSTVTISPTSTTPTITDDQTWILTSYNSGTKVITVSMSTPNNTGSDRSGTITVRHPSDSSLTKYITVTQLAH